MLILSSFAATDLSRTRIQGLLAVLVVHLEQLRFHSHLPCLTG
jgi:hypothetical protein